MIVLSLVPIILLFLLVVAREWVILAERESWQQERRELLNRIQHPEVVVPLSEARPQVVEVEPDEINLVGEIVAE